MFQCADVNLSITSKHTRFKLFEKPLFQLRLCPLLHEAEILSTAGVFYFLDECGMSKFKWCSLSSWILSIKIINKKNCITDTHNLNPITGMWLEQRLAFIVQCWWGKLPVVAVFFFSPPNPPLLGNMTGVKISKGNFDHRCIKSSSSTPPNWFLAQAEAQQGMSFTDLRQFFLDQMKRWLKNWNITWEKCGNYSIMIYINTI